MSKQFWIQLHYADLLQDTITLSCQSFGGWVRVLMRMWHLETGELEGNIQFWARVMVCSPQEAKTIIGELLVQDICIVGEDCNGIVTLKSRRLSREYKNKRNNRIRKQRYDEKHSCNAKVTENERKSNATKDKVKDKVKDIKEKINKKEKPVDNFLDKKLTGKISFIFSTFQFPLSNEDLVKTAAIAVRKNKSLSTESLIDQLDAFFRYFKAYEKPEDKDPRYRGIKSKKHLANLIFKWLERTHEGKNDE